MADLMFVNNYTESMCAQNSVFKTNYPLGVSLAQSKLLTQLSTKLIL